MISIIIPTYNEEDVLKSCLESLSLQTFRDFEIIIVDDGSSDSTKDIVEGFKSKISNLKFLKQEHKGAGAARNLGAKNTQGSILVFVDADMTFDKDFLTDLVGPIKKGEVKGTFSREEYVANWDNVWARCWNINESWEPKRRHPKNYPNYQPVFRAVLKTEFDRVGGFTPGGYDDDWSLGKKLGYDAVSVEGAIFYHKNPSSLSEIYSHAKWVGKRKYKYGLLGYLVGLLRSSLPVSLIVGLYKSIVSSTYQFAIFKVVYDLGIFMGILELLTKGKSSK